MNVLSLFDGMSCGQQALERQGIKVYKYYASEIDKHAIQITQKNYPNTIQLGSVVNVDIHNLEKIDLLIGGSPCQSFSFAGKRKGMSTKDEIEILSLDQYLELKEQNFEFEGQSYLFWEYMRILTDLRKLNPDVKFLLENVMMGEKWEKVLSMAIGVNPIEINSSLVSAQNRRRLYWTNIGMKPAGLFGDLESIIQQPKDRGILLKHILESEVDEKYFLKEKTLSYFIRNNQKQIEEGNGYRFAPTDGNKKADSVTTKPGSRMQDNFVNCKVIQLNEAQEFGGQPRQQNRVYSTEGQSPALLGQLSSGTHAILVDEPKCAAMRGRNPENPKSRQVGLNTEQMIEQRNDSKTNCLTCVQKDNLIIIPEATKKGYVEIEPGECSDFENPNSETRRGRKMEDEFIVHNTMPRSGDPKKGGTGHLSRNDGKTYYLDTGNTNAIEILNDNQLAKFNPNIDADKSNTLTLAISRRGSSSEYMDSISKIAKLTSRIRRLTPTECERLQTVKDGYTEGVSDTQRYRMLGNGWTIEVISHIFSYLDQF